MVKKILAIIFLILFCFTVSTSCKKEEEPHSINYNGRVSFSFYRYVISSESPVKSLKSEFLLSNHTTGIPTLYENPETGEKDTFYDQTVEYPNQRCYIIKTKEDASQIFNQLNNLDFETQMIVIVSFTAMDNCSHNLWDLFKEGTKLKIEIKKKQNSSSVAPNCLQIICGIIMDKLDDVTEAEVVLKTETEKVKKRG